MSEQLTQIRTQIAAPISGILVPLDQVPDPVFAKKMVGDGFSIDPLSNLLVAPVPGEVVDLQPSHHAVTIRSEDGLEILMHIGLDTVSLLGEGFTPKVREGATVAVGDPLIEFDLDAVAKAAKSLLTQVVITNMDLVDGLDVQTGLVSHGDLVATVELRAAGGDDADSGVATTATSEAIIVPNPTGLHARPTATLVNLAKRYRSDIRLRRGDDSANAKSIVSIMGLAVGRGEKVVVTAHGSDAAEAVAEVAKAIREGLGEEAPPGAGTEDTAPLPAVAPEPEPVKEAPRSGDPDLLIGVAASPGLGIGTVVQLRHDDIVVAEFGDDHHTERRKLNSAIDRASLDLSALERKL